MACGVEAFVSEFVMGVANERIPDRGASVKLVSTAVLSSPESAFCDDEVTCSADETCERVCR